MKYSVLIAEKCSDDEVTIKVNDLIEFLDRTYDVIYKDGYDEGFKAGKQYSEPVIIPNYKNLTSPSIIPSYRDQWRINECDCDKVVCNTQTSTSTTMNK